MAPCEISPLNAAIFSFPKMSTEPTILGLKKLLKRNDLNDLSRKLENDVKHFDDWKKRTEDNWKEFYGLAGVDIYNYLNPRRQGNCVLTTGNEMDVDIPEKLKSTSALQSNEFHGNDSLLTEDLYLSKNSHLLSLSINWMVSI